MPSTSMAIARAICGLLPAARMASPELGARKARVSGDRRPRAAPCAAIAMLAPLTVSPAIVRLGQAEQPRAHPLAQAPRCSVVASERLPLPMTNRLTE